MTQHPQGRARRNAIVGVTPEVTAIRQGIMDAESVQALAFMQSAVDTRVRDVLNEIKRVQVKGFGTAFDIASGVKELGSALKDVHGGVKEAGKILAGLKDIGGEDFLKVLGNNLAGGKIIEAVQHVFKDFPDNIVVEILKHIGAEALAEFTEAVTPFIGPIMKLGTGVVGFIEAGYLAYQGHQMSENMVLIRTGDVSAACNAVLKLWDDSVADKALTATLDSLQGIVGIGLAAGDAAGGAGALSAVGGPVMAACRALYAFGALLKELFDAFMECRAVNALIAKGKITATELFKESPALGAWVVTLLESSTLAAFMLKDIQANPHFMADFEKRYMKPVSKMKQAAFKMIGGSRIEPVIKPGSFVGKYEVQGNLKTKLAAYVKSGPSKIKFKARRKLLEVQNVGYTVTGGISNGARKLWQKITG
jgi:hypothetical protein